MKVNANEVKGQTTANTNPEVTKPEATKPEATKPQPKGLGAQLAKEREAQKAKAPEVKPKELTPEEKATQQAISDAIKLLEGHGFKVSAPGRRELGSMPRVKTIANDIEYSKLTDALKAHGFNVDKDWVEVRKQLKDKGEYVKKDAKGEDVTFKLV